MGNEVVCARAYGVWLARPGPRGYNSELMVYAVLVALYVIVCLLLLVVILLQQGKGGDIAAAFGGASSQTAFGARAGATVLTRATTILGVLFMIGAIVVGIMGRQGPGSLMRGVSGPAPTTQQTPAPAPAPAAPQPEKK